MNRNKTIWGITALALCLALAGCLAGDEAGAMTIPSLLLPIELPKMEPVSSLQDFPETMTPSITLRNVGSRDEAITLFTDATTALTAALLAQDTKVYDGDTQLTIANIEAYSHGKDKTITVNFEEELTDGTFTTGGVFTGTINGSNTATATVNGPQSLATYYGSNFTDRVESQPAVVPEQGLVNKNDSVTEKFSGNRSFAITEGFYGSGAVNSPYVAGYVTVNYSGTAAKTQTDEKGKNDIYTESSSGDANFSVTIVAFTSDGGTGAKFRLSGIARDNTATTRAVSSGREVTISNLEVYANNGHKLFDLPPDQFSVDTAAWFEFAQDVVARSLFEKFYP
jgi:hypothetical protein